MNTPAQAGSAQRKQQRIASLKSSTKGAPTTRAREKERLTLSWLGVFGSITTPMVKTLLDIQGDGYLPKLQRDGLVQSQEVGKLNGKMWTLTPKGQEAAALVLGWDPSRVRPDKLNISIATHNELAQLAALRTLEASEKLSVEHICRLAVERDLRQKGVAVPDVVYSAEDPDTGGLFWVGLEIELSPKYNKELTDKMVRLIELVVQQQRCDRLHVCWYLKSQKDRDRYERAWQDALNKVKTFVRTDAYVTGTQERMQKLTYPTCSTHELPE